MKNSVLIIEDDELIRDSLTELLYYEGYPVLAVEDAKDALSALRSGTKPGLIILDLMLPVMSGCEFLETRKDDPELASIPVLVTSGVPSRYAREQATHWMDKPIEVEFLLDIVQRHCDFPVQPQL